MLPPAVVGVVATASLAFSKNMTTSNEGRLPSPHGIALRCLVADSAPSAADTFSAADLLSATRVTPSTPRRRDIKRATEVWSVVQPCRVIAGAEIAPRSELE